jgi:transposase
MQRYIGLDVHASSCTVAVVGQSGRRLRSLVVETNGHAIIEAIKTIPGQKHLCLEEGTQSAWLYEVLRPCVHELVVTQRRSRRRGTKNDELDAYGLADDLRQGKLDTVVFKGPARFTTLRELSRGYSMQLQDLIRVQARLKSVFRSRGAWAPGRDVYTLDERKAWLGRLPKSSRRLAARLYEQYDVLVDLVKETRVELVAESEKHAVTKLLRSCPGLGAVRVAQLVPIVVTPHRFRTKQHFWSYCGLSVVTRSSSDWVQAPDGQWVRAAVIQTRGLNRRCNRTLKNVFKGAAHTVVTVAKSSPPYADYQRMLEAGTKPSLARVTLARKLAAITLKMWKAGEVYSPHKYRNDSKR